MVGEESIPVVRSPDKGFPGDLQSLRQEPGGLRLCPPLRRKAREFVTDKKEFFFVFGKYSF